MDDLIARIRAAIDEDERLALPAARREGGGKGEWRLELPEVRDDLNIMVVRHAWNTEGRHIVRHDPARVLRQVAAMRKILDAHQLVLKMGSTVNGRELLYYCQGCGGRDWDLESVGRTPCPTVLALAEVYGIEP